MFTHTNTNARGAPHKARRTRQGSQAPLRIEDLYISIDEDEPLSDAEKQMRQEFLKQVKEAFETEPTLSGVVHGRRRIRLGKDGSRASYFPSMKNALGGRSAVYLPMESRMEARYALELERDTRVLAFRTQSIELSLPGTGNPVFPDFMILDKAGHLHLREVKADLRYVSPEKKSRIEHLSRRLCRYGITYDAVDASNMPSDKKYENLKWLYQQIMEYPTHEQANDFLALPFVRRTYRDLKGDAIARGFGPNVVPYLLFTDVLSTNWDLPITELSEVWK